MVQPINVTEFGEVLADGNRDNTNDDTMGCLNFTSNHINRFAGYGKTAAKDKLRTQAGAASCAEKKHLYCFDNDYYKPWRCGAAHDSHEQREASTSRADDAARRARWPTLGRRPARRRNEAMISVLLPVVQLEGFEVFARTEAPSTWPGVRPSRGPHVVGHPASRRR